MEIGRLVLLLAPSAARAPDRVGRAGVVAALGRRVLGVAAEAAEGRIPGA